MANNDVDDIENPFNFTIRATVIPDTGIQIIDNDADEFSTTGNWGLVSGSRKGHNNSFRYAHGGSGSNTAAWTFAVIPGQYQVAASWIAHSNRSPDAPFTISNGGVDILTKDINQKIAPSGIVDSGTVFTTLGVFNISDTTLAVRLSDDANGVVIADAIRIERVGDIPIGPEIVVTDGGNDIVDGTGTLDFGEVEQGMTAVRTLSVYNFGTEDLVLTEPITTTAGFTATNFGKTLLEPNASSTFDLVMDTSSVVSQTGSVSFGTNDSDESAFGFTVQGNVIPPSTVQVVDNGDSGFSTTGVWRPISTSNGHNNDFHWAYGSTSPTGNAHWAFTIDEPGQYRVSVHWRAHSNRATNASFSMNADGGPTVVKNQQIRPNAANGVEESGTVFEDLGVFSFSGTSVEVTLSNLADGVLIADAVRIERVGD